MDKFDNIGENEIRIIGTNHEEKQPEQPKRRTRYIVAIVLAVLIISVLVVFLIRGCNDEPSAPAENNCYKKVCEEDQGPSYVQIVDTIINNVSLHQYIPVNAKPKLVMGLLKEIPSQYILGAMAADIGLIQDKYQVIGAFVYHGEMKSHSKSKFGFCAILKDTMVIGNELTTSYFEQAIAEKGDFFRQNALIHEGKMVNKLLAKNKALRRSLCLMNDGRYCIIDTDMSVTVDDFAEALRQYGVREAISLMGSGAALRWAEDKDGRKHIAGADEYEFPDAINYIVWEKSL